MSFRATLLVLTLAAPRARAANEVAPPTTATPTRHNITCGVSAGPTTSELDVAGRPTDAGGGSATIVAADIAFHERPLQVISLGARASFIPLPQDDPADRVYFDLGLEPRLWPASYRAAAFYLAVPFGLAWPAVDPQPHRGYTSKVRVESGYYFGGAFGLEITVSKRKPLRLYAELGFLTHVSHLDVTLTSHVPELASGNERWHYVDHFFRFGVGGSFGFVPL